MIFLIPIFIALSISSASATNIEAISESHRINKHTLMRAHQTKDNLQRKKKSFKTHKILKKSWNTLDANEEIESSIKFQKIAKSELDRVKFLRTMSFSSDGLPRGGSYALVIGTKVFYYTTDFNNETFYLADFNDKNKKSSSAVSLINQVNNCDSNESGSVCPFLLSQGITTNGNLSLVKHPLSSSHDFNIETPDEQTLEEIESNIVGTWKIEDKEDGFKTHIRINSIFAVDNQIVFNYVRLGSNKTQEISQDLYGFYADGIIIYTTSSRQYSTIGIIDTTKTEDNHASLFSSIGNCISDEEDILTYICEKETSTDDRSILDGFNFAVKLDE